MPARLLAIFARAFFDIHGAMVETNMSEKTLSIEMNKLKQARYSIGIAMSAEKIQRNCWCTAWKIY